MVEFLFFISSFLILRPGLRGWGEVGVFFWTTILSLPGLLGAVVYLYAGMGLRKRWKIGYYAHIVGALFATLSCVGLAYTIYAFIYTFNDEFTENFFAESQ